MLHIEIHSLGLQRLPEEPCTTHWPGLISPDTHQSVSLPSLSAPPLPSPADCTPPVHHSVSPATPLSHTALCVCVCVCVCVVCVCLCVLCVRLYR